MENIFNTISGPGRRMTKARKAIVAILSIAGAPLLATELSDALQKRGMEIDRSTIYRQLAFLESALIVQPVQFDERGRRYELAAADHHHHLVCVSCRTVEDISCQKTIIYQEERIFRDKNFKVSRHSLEFYGLCARCQ